ncbi:MAG: hypothetical protein PHC88_02190 [Terrimicrobiaceae bacterium]|nr:hypothetical protein [Terrimicrobiaceae bacterium]
MKALLAIGFALVAASAMGQEFVAPHAPRKAPVVHEPVAPKPTIEGIVKEIFTIKKPWQLVNPLAPKEYGNGENNVAHSDRDPGKPKGFILFAFEW